MQTKITHTAKRLIFVNGSIVVGLLVLLLINIHRIDTVYSRVVAVVVGLVAVWAIYLDVQKTVLTDEGIRFFELRRFWRLRPAFVPWREVQAVGPHSRNGQRYVGVRLVDGREVVLSAPADLFDKPRFERDLATIQQWHTRHGQAPYSSDSGPGRPLS